MALNFDHSTEDVIACLERTIPIAMEHRAYERLLADQPQLSERDPSTRPTRSCIGLSAALIREGRCVWAKGFGLRNSETRAPVSVDTVFSSWSCAKPITAYAALRMCELRALDLDQPLCEFVAEPFIPDEPRMKSVTARMVLSHTTGLSHNQPERQFFHEPGERFRYSNQGFAYLQLAIEQTTGVQLARHVAENILEPLGMDKSSLNWRDEYRSDLADLHNGDGTVHDAEREFYRSHYNQAFHGLLTTASDYARFVCQLLRPSAVPGLEAVSEMLTPVVQISESLSWGLGWGIQHSKDGDLFWHHGGFGHNLVMASRDHGIGVVILTNCAGGLSFEPIVKAALGGDHPILPWQGPWYTPF